MCLIKCAWCACLNATSDLIKMFVVCYVVYCIVYYVVYYKQQQIDFQNLQLLQIQSDEYNFNQLKKQWLV